VTDFEHVVADHYSLLYNFALALTRQEADACDLTQETFYIWAIKGHQVRDQSKIKSWLLTTLHRLFLGQRRHERRFPHHEISAMEHCLSQTTPEAAAQLDAATVRAALLQVEEPFRPPLVLFYFEEYSYKDIAEILGVPIGTVMSRLARGKEQLRRLLDEKSAEHDNKFTPFCDDRTANPA
jgi:RNA polymerase sigma-70 factor (ECF subfamily)